MSLQSISNVATIDLCDRRIRVMANDQLLVDSYQAKLLRRPGRFAIYLFPRCDINMSLLTVSSEQGADPNPKFLSKADGDFEQIPDQWWDIQCADKTIALAAWSFSETPGDYAGLQGYIGFVWEKMDHWYEEDEEVFGHAKSPYHRVDILKTSRHVVVKANGQIIADSKETLAVFETGLPVQFYFPDKDINLSMLKPSEVTTHCCYKGTASYWHIDINDEFENAVWAYNPTYDMAEKINGRKAFFSDFVDIYVDGAKQAPMFFGA